MSRSDFARRCLVALVVLCFATGMLAAQQQKQFQPEVGQTGKDVVWVPTPQTLVEKMLDMAKVTPQDIVTDLGSGDGRTVIAAAKRGARATGIEFNPDMVELSKRNAAEAGVTARATFINADLFATDFSKSTVVTMFLLPELNLRLRPKLLDMKPGTRVVSNSFTMEDWSPDETATVENDCVNWCTAYLWIVPAKVDGTWKLAQGDLTIKQEFQMISGTLASGSNNLPISGKLTGDQIRFSAGGSEYTGRVTGIAMSGTVTKSGAAAGSWSATRTFK